MTLFFHSTFQIIATFRTLGNFHPTCSGLGWPQASIAGANQKELSGTARKVKVADQGIYLQGAHWKLVSRSMWSKMTSMFDYFAAISNGWMAWSSLVDCLYRCFYLYKLQSTFPSGLCCQICQKPSALKGVLRWNHDPPGCQQRWQGAGGFKDFRLNKSIFSRPGAGWCTMLYLEMMPKGTQ